MEKVQPAEVSNTKTNNLYTPKTNISKGNEQLLFDNSFNGKLDAEFKQSKNTGDCGLLALIMAMKDKPEGKKYLESLLNYNKENNTLDVSLKGTSKTYTVSQDELSKYDKLSTGDGDIKAIELAIAKHLHENGNKKTEFNPSEILSGMSEYTAFKLLKGDRSISSYKNTQEMIDDFGNPSKFFTFTVYKQTDNPETDEVVLKSNIALNSQKHIYEAILCNHAYAIINSDKDYIYFKNPHDSADTLRVERNMVEKANPAISCNKLD